MAESPDFSFAKFLLNHWGLSVQDIQPSQEPSQEIADFLIEVDGLKFLIEEKRKLDPHELTEARNATLDSGQVYSASTPMSYSNRHSKILRKAKNQLLSSSSETRPDFRLVWFTMEGAEAEAEHRRLLATLYGKATLIEVEGNYLRHCYFFHESEFFRLGKAVDGVISGFMFGDSLNYKLCLNPYSQRYKELKESRFAELFGDAVEDPYQAEVDGTALVMDGDTDRRNPQAVLVWLQEKYSLGKLVEMPMHMFSATFVHPKVTPPPLLGP